MGGILIPAEVTELIEFSEANAYASLACGMRHAQQAGLPSWAYRFGSARVIVTPEARSTLNMNRVIGLDVHEEATDEVLRGIEALYSSHALAFGIELGPHPRSPAIEALLRRRRLRRTVVTCMRYRNAAIANVPATSAMVSQARTLPECEAVAQLCVSVFRVPEVIGRLLIEAHYDARWRHWFIRDNSVVVAAGMSFVDREVAWLGWDATLPEARGRGLHTALIAARLNEAAAAGCKFVTTETAADSPARTDPSGRNYQNLGFDAAYERTTYVALHKS